EKGTARELDHVSVVSFNLEHQNPSDFGLLPNPGIFEKDDTLVADAPSPLTLMDPRGGQIGGALFVRAVGFACRSIHCDWKRGGDATIELDQSCDLEITLDPPIDGINLGLTITRTLGREGTIEQLRYALERLGESRATTEVARAWRAALLKDIAALQRGDLADALLHHSGQPLVRSVVDASH